jgi:hypothetical protein
MKKLISSLLLFSFVVLVFASQVNYEIYPEITWGEVGTKSYEVIYDGPNNEYIAIVINGEIFIIKK